MPLDTSSQYDRQCSLQVFGLNNDKGIDLSNLRIKFAIKKTSNKTPNSADIRVYNLNQETAVLIRNKFNTVKLKAGYPGNIGIIFQGTIKQVILGRETSTDTFIDIVASDGDEAFLFAYVNGTVGGNGTGAKQLDQINKAIEAMKPYGVTQGYVNLDSTEQLPRGKSMYGNATNYLTNVANTTRQDWSIQNGKVQFVSLTSYLPGEVIILKSNTGLIGTPQQTNQGVNMKCLLNPLLQIGGRVQIDNSSVQELKINLEITDPKKIIENTPPKLNQDGTYFILAQEHTGDTRGQEWYTSLITLYVNLTSNPAYSVMGL